MRNACSLLLSLLTALSLPPRLRIDIVFEGVRMPATCTDALAEEVKAIWTAYGVDIRTAKIAEVRPGAIALRVRLADRENPRLPTEALGSIDFRGDVPEPSIVLYPLGTSELVEMAFVGHSLEWPTTLRERVLGRVLGRALAHEIGHFLLRTQLHSTTGLMRARQMIPDLMREDRRCCLLSADDVSALHARLAAGARQRTAPIAE